jgi:uroporphyrinogen decarboxylase
MGVEVDFAPDPRIAAPLRTVADVARLRFGEPAEELGYVLEAVRVTQRALHGRVPLIGFCGAPLTVLSYLVEGRTSRDFAHTKRMLFGEPALFRRLMEGLSDLSARYLLAQIAAGVDAVQIFDSWAGTLSARDYGEHVLPHVRELVGRVTAARPSVPVILFVRGGSRLVALLRDVPADVIGVDWTIELGDAIEVLGPGRVVQGNLDPGLLLGDPERLFSRAREVVAAGRAARAHVFNLGHGIAPETDPELARRLVEAVHAA